MGAGHCKAQESMVGRNHPQLRATSNVYAGMINHDFAEETIYLMPFLEDIDPPAKSVYIGTIYHEITKETTYFTGGAG